MLGKTSDMDGYFLNFRVPFYNKIRVTAQLPAGVEGFNVYTIFRGVENVPLSVPGFGPLPAGTRLSTVSNHALPVASLGFIPIVNISAGSGLVLAHSRAGPPVTPKPKFSRRRL